LGRNKESRIKAYKMTSNQAKKSLDFIEEKLGNNLVFLADTLDLYIRQKDKNVIKALNDLNEAWVEVCRLRKAIE
jgi:hypothetical protein